MIGFLLIYSNCHNDRMALWILGVDVYMGVINQLWLLQYRTVRSLHPVNANLHWENKS